MAVGPQWIAQQQAEHVAIGHQSGALAPRQQDALGNPGGAPPMGARRPVGRIKIRIAGDRPYTQTGTGGSLHQPATVLLSLACGDWVLPQRAIVAEGAR